MKIKELKELAKTWSFRHGIMDTFFEAMLSGYASDVKKGTMSELPGSKMIPYACGSWEAVDTYLVTPLCNRSGGMTVISYEEIPVWMMSYFGEYDKEAIPCLKAALRHLYERENFYGWRGPDIFRHGGFTYRNSPDNTSSMPDHFTGIEEVCGIDGTVKGWHRYHGGFMI